MSAENNIQYHKNEDNPLLIFCSVSELLQYLSDDMDKCIIKSTDTNINEKFIDAEDAIDSLFDFFRELISIFNDNDYYQDTNFARILGYILEEQSDYTFQWFDKSYFIHGELFNRTLDEIYTNNITLTTATKVDILQELIDRLETLRYQLTLKKEESTDKIRKLLISVIKKAIIPLEKLYCVYDRFEEHINQPKIAVQDNVTDNVTNNLEELISVEILNYDVNGKMSTKNIIMTRKSFNNLQKIKS